MNALTPQEIWDACQLAGCDSFDILSDMEYKSDQRLEVWYFLVEGSLAENGVLWSLLKSGIVEKTTDNNYIVFTEKWKALLATGFTFGAKYYHTVENKPNHV